jgi:hypothetical protein
MQLYVLISTALAAPTLFCSQVIPTCPICSGLETCKIIPQSTNACSTAICTPKKIELVCTKIQPTCVNQCDNKTQECKTFSATHEECQCVFTVPNFACPKIMPICSEPCRPDEYCKTFFTNHNECPRAACVLKQ